jgi:predicted ArsR family transcriptional regulator
LIYYKTCDKISTLTVHEIGVTVGLRLHETRQKIIAYLKENVRATVDELAATVNLTPMAVRYHLNVLQSENLIFSSDVRRPAAGRGRPQQVYQLTEQADELFPVDYYSLTDYLLDELTIRLGREGIADLFGSIATRLVQEVPPPQINQPTADRLNELVAFLSGKGFVSDWEQQDSGDYLIYAYSCPYRQIAREHGHVCQLDKQIISAMLNTKPERLACLSDGDSHCIYRVSQPIELVTQ